MRIIAIIVIAVSAAAASTLAREGAAAPACHPDRQHRVAVNLDVDVQKEAVTAFEVTNCSHTKQAAGITIEDRCDGGWRSFRVATGFRFFYGRIEDAFVVTNADAATRRPEIFFALTGYGANGPVGAAKVIRLDRSGTCSAVRALFAYDPARAVLPPTTTLTAWNVRLQDVAPAFPGKEVILTETLKGPPSEVCCATVSTRTRQYRYDRTKRRYVVYSDKTIDRG